MSVKVTDSPTSHALQELHDRHQRLYEEPDIDVKLADIIREFPASKLNEWDILRILRTSQSVFFDTHVEVVSGHHTATYVRFESIARESRAEARILRRISFVFLRVPRRVTENSNWLGTTSA